MSAARRRRALSVFPELKITNFTLLLSVCQTENRMNYDFFAPLLVRPLACSPPGSFAPLLIRPLVHLPLGLFATWLDRPLADSPLHPGQFYPC